MKLIDDISGKTLTIDGDILANWFIGAYCEEIKNEPISVNSYLKLCHYDRCRDFYEEKYTRHWDDGTEMTPEEWVRMTKYLLLNIG